MDIMTSTKVTTLSDVELDAVSGGGWVSQTITNTQVNSVGYAGSGSDIHQVNQAVNFNVNDSELEDFTIILAALQDSEVEF
jgi:hypothetical protein